MIGGAFAHEYAEIFGRPEWTRTIDLFRVKNEVSNPKPFGCHAFPLCNTLQNTPFLTSFVDELLTSFSVEFVANFCNSEKVFWDFSERSAGRARW
jgi:hypothetical protein